MIKIPKDIVIKIYEHGQRDIPAEACGYLAGKGDLVAKIFPMTNLDHSPEHFTLDPKEQFSVMKQARQEGFELLAIYHTHPASLARPSAEDINLAFDPNIIYVIASLQGERAMRAFKIKSGIVENINLEIVE